MKKIHSFNDYKKLNEASFKVGDHYSVKPVLEVPESLVNDYIDKVSAESSKDALQYFTKSEIAEVIVRHIVERNLDVDQLPVSLVVGETEDEIEAESIDDSEELEADLNVDTDEEDTDDDTELEFDSTEKDKSDDDTTITDEELDF